MKLNVFVMIPYGRLKTKYLNDYRIGRYPAADSVKAGVSCESPRGFVEVTEENGNARLSPHFRLRQFLCKQKGGYPKYVVLKEKLMFKLEYILAKVNEAGYPCMSFTVMSGYRTPYYNRLLGNSSYSRHLYGEAADIFVDHQPEDNMMDDLNRDGKLDWTDAKVLCGIIERLYGTRPYEKFIGGLAAYEKTPYHGPFVHVDVRGAQGQVGKVKTPWRLPCPCAERSLAHKRAGGLWAAAWPLHPPGAVACACARIPHRLGERVDGGSGGDGPLDKPLRLF